LWPCSSFYTDTTQFCGFSFASAVALYFLQRETQIASSQLAAGVDDLRAGTAKVSREESGLPVLHLASVKWAINCILVLMTDDYTPGPSGRSREGAGRAKGSVGTERGGGQGQRGGQEGLCESVYKCPLRSSPWTPLTMLERSTSGAA
jgi:hypothetical protein